MNRNLDQVKNALARITQTKDAMDILYEYERVFEQVGLSSYKNWYNGELLDGPQIDKYWVTCQWMFPKKSMPDPDGALRLTKIGCKVSFSEDNLKMPRTILSPTDWEDRSTKRAKMEDVPVWVVTIKIPMKYIEDGFDDINQYLDDLEGDEVVYSDDNSEESEFSFDDSEGEGEDDFSNFTGSSRLG